VAAQQTIREMEEAADITAEMEEVQAEELKALNREMEDRETTIRNLEEAIKMYAVFVLCVWSVCLRCIKLSKSNLTVSIFCVRTGNASGRKTFSAQSATIEV
jgi:hypothetical protein